MTSANGGGGVPVVPAPPVAVPAPASRDTPMPDPVPTSRSVAERVESVVRDVLGLDTAPVTPTSRLREDLGADSVDAMMLVMAIEREFDGTIPEEEAARLATFAEVVEYVSRKMSEREPS